MFVAEELLRLGGVATRQQLVALTSRPKFEAAVAAGVVTRLARGRYALPTAAQDVAAAHAVGGVLCLTSAALRHGWGVKLPPERPQVCLPRNRKPGADVSRVEVHRLRLGPDDTVDGTTSRDRTLLDCLRELPFDEALAIADSALREGHSRPRLLAATRDARGPGSARMRQIAELATPLAANPFESVLRAIALGVPGLDVRPQVSLHRSDGVLLGRPDLVDEALGVVLEADSFEWHGGRSALVHDARRYNAFVVDGWLVLRFSWEEVMFHPGRVSDVLRAAVEERTNRLCPACRAAS